MAKVSYASLQKKYYGKMVALTKDEDKIIAASKDITTLFKKIEKSGYAKEDCVFVGPVERQGTVSI